MAELAQKKRHSISVLHRFVNAVIEMVREQIFYLLTEAIHTPGVL
jgi:hypothetical protein